MVNTEWKYELNKPALPVFEASKAESENITEGSPAFLEYERMYLQMREGLRKAKFEISLFSYWVLADAAALVRRDSAVFSLNTLLTVGENRVFFRRNLT